MGEKPDILATENGNGIPKRLEWSSNLVSAYDNSILKKARNYLRKPARKRGPYSVSKWKEIIGTTKNDNEGGKKFLDNLKQWNALIDKGTESEGKRYYPVYKLDEKNLLKAFHKTEMYKECLDLFIKTINQQEEGLKVVRDY